MATTTSGVRSAVVIPEDIRSVLDIRMRTDLLCPPDIDVQLAKIPFFRKKVAAANATIVPSTHSPSVRAIPSFRSGATPGHQHQQHQHQHQNQHQQHHRSSNNPAATVSSGNGRFGNLSNVAPNTWRSGTGGSNGGGGFTGSTTRNSEQTHEDGWTTVLNRRKRTAAVSAEANAAVTTPVSAPVAAATTTTDEVTTPSPNDWRPTRFQNMETKMNESVEDRILGKVRSKINKIGESTYPATKGFMQQILDAGETEFLDECMKFIFQKAATEPSFCGLYARLLHELADEFSHLRDEMQRKFRDYTTIFCETENTADVGTKDYGAFIEAQERKKFRRGYSQFVAELAKYGEVNLNDFRYLIEQIVRSVQDVSKVPESTLICEEYVDCLSKMCIASASIISKSDWIRSCLDILKEVSTSPRTVSPGLTNKAKFAIMDILDFAKAGWRKPAK